MRFGILVVISAVLILAALAVAAGAHAYHPGMGIFTGEFYADTGHGTGLATVILITSVVLIVGGFFYSIVRQNDDDEFR
jgi:multisubunit Na+/H+ antiporter MnhB subunit